MAMDLSSVKASRTTAKRAVTNAAKRLEQAIGLQLSSTPQLANNLEKRFVEFNEFCDSFNSIAIDQAVPVENTLVNGLTPEQYENETLQTFRLRCSLIVTASQLVYPFPVLPPLLLFT